MTKLRHMIEKRYLLIDNHNKKGKQTTYNKLVEISDLNSYLRFLEIKGLWSIEEFNKSKSGVD